MNFTAAHLGSGKLEVLLQLRGRRDHPHPSATATHGRLDDHGVPMYKKWGKRFKVESRETRGGRTGSGWLVSFRLVAFCFVLLPFVSSCCVFVSFRFVCFFAWGAGRVEVAQQFSASIYLFTIKLRQTYPTHPHTPPKRRPLKNTYTPENTLTIKKVSYIVHGTRAIDVSRSMQSRASHHSTGRTNS